MSPLSIELSRQECWYGLPFPSPGDLSDPGTEPRSPALQADSLPSEPSGNPQVQSWTLTNKCEEISYSKKSTNKCRRNSGIEIHHLKIISVNNLGKKHQWVVVNMGNSLVRRGLKAHPTSPGHSWISVGSSARQGSLRTVPSWLTWVYTFPCLLGFASFLIAYDLSKSQAWTKFYIKI